ncbi:MAG TPA: nucleotidyltransferase domain-containing protein [Rugosimonospora sp.]|nr:nucleotidyltransferase domain-containing protein [Rugosimonospora sp.]
MLSARERDEVRQRLLHLAREDPAIAGAALTGSHAAGRADRWSDIDLVLGVDGPPAAAMQTWTRRLYGDFGAVHHWDLPSGPAVYRVYLLPGGLEVDIAFTPASAFGPRGRTWRTVFGQARGVEPDAPPDADELAGRAWHSALHAWTCIQRQRWWQAEYWIGALRGQVLALACRRLGHPTGYAKGAHLLPPELTAPLEATLVRALDGAELTRALRAATTAFAEELPRTDPALAARLHPVLTELSTAEL